jgi:type IV pilus assembly protein PilC
MKRNERVAGFLSADTQRLATAALRKDRIRVIKLVAFRDRDDERFDALLDRPVWELAASRVLVPGAQAERALTQIASLLRAGVPILRAFKLAARLSPYFVKRSLYCAANRLAGGGALHAVLRREMPFLSDVTLSLIAIGEANGTLEDMFGYAADLMTRSRKVKAEFLQAMSYPAVVVLAASGAITFMMKMVIPKILKYLTATSVPLPAITQALIDTTDFLKAYGVWLALSPVAVAVLIALLRRSDGVAILMDRGMLRIPFFGKLIGAAANAMWTRTLGILMHSGINVIQALRLTARTLGNRYLRQQFDWIEDLTKQGHPLSTGARVTAISKVCPLAESMLRIGESTGLIDQNLAQVATFYQEDLERRLTLLGKMIEPAMFVVVGGMVAFVYIGFFMGLMALSKR